MKIDELFIEEERSVLDAMRQLDETGRRILFIAPQGHLKAVITDSDIRRFVLHGGKLEDSVTKAANYRPYSLPVGKRRCARTFLLEKSIDAIPLLNKAGVMTDVVFADDFDIDMKKQLDLPVVIMAGGLGTRLYPYTKILPKPLIPIGEQPIIELMIERFHVFGCNRYNLIVNYKKGMMKSYFADLEKDYEVTFTDEDTPLGTGGGLSLLKGKMDKTFFLTNCDVLIDADYADVYQYHKNHGNLITMVCAFKNVTIPYGVITLGEDGEIAAMTEKPQYNFLTNTGMYVVEPQVVEELETGKRQNFTDIIDFYRAKGEKVGIYPVSENSWMDMGQLEELENMRRRLENG